MAEIRLRKSETRRDRLPEVCMACGKPSESHIKKQFSWFPPWVGALILLGLIPYVIVASILTKKMTVDVPVCVRHRGYFGKRILWTILALLFWIGISAAAFILVGVLIPERDQGPAFGFAFMAFIGTLIIAIIIIAIIQSRAIKPKEITDESITLIRINDGFVDAMEIVREERRGLSRREQEDLGIDRPRRRRDEYEQDDDRPRRGGDQIRAEPPDEDLPRRRRRDED